MGLLDGKVAVVTGIANKRSIAWGIARAFVREGAQLIVTYQNERLKENLDKLLPEIDAPVQSLLLDVTNDELMTEFGKQLQHLAPQGVHILVHSIAYADRQDLEGRFLDTKREGYMLAQMVSAYSLTELTRAVYPSMQKAQGGSIIAMTYQGSTRVMPNYNVMGVAKAALESSVRYLAFDLGKEHIRVNAISAGPVKTLAASGVKGISQALHNTEERAPIPENISTDDVGNAAVFLASDWAKHITGHILFVDSGFHIMGF
ncbi:enoyl-ACP reductase FabI [Sulfobacillus thermosulfidooxidans]|uniref:Enoyl-[acyl-carrier-protein] reductase [NADH] n=1 Tax=Sulfobacillus thermosulfidooxidans TaxID=28034 RepID=A0A1R0IQB9_SULTH|nr:enoyl-ACP reductase [Sulfobacillus thermosulfidooxidans]OLZ09833.1 enoyl-ACP reductase [Sulfobacillus thermosulfidooxidans]OLZ15861.1 enoyl-ACP reductase [Sulfobacillus thermosulfidooxidans]OLZ18292.1 enoyl-ACP reductase [Sulfobacillus thermosulfidooxidans]PSR21772.1 MAG: enoyl-ACP reductase [Sulfobacillus thermosulfidooxidans]